MDSLGFGAKVIGPHVGAFADLAEDKIIKTFTAFDEIDALLSHAGETGRNSEEVNLEKFLKENSWEQFAEHFYTRLMAEIGLSR